MIKYFAIKNFRSFKDEQIFELDLHLDKNTPYVAQPTVGVAGANASGKSNLLQALSFVIWFMQDSFLRLDENNDIPCPTFMTQGKQATQFHLIFAQMMTIKNQKKSIDESKLIDFEYELKLTEKNVITEKLFYYPFGRKRKVYSRSGNTIQYGKDISAIETKDLRVNCSVVAFAAQFASQEIASTCRDYKIFSNLTYKGLKEVKFTPELIKKFKRRKQLDKISEMLKIADIGIEKIEYSEIKEANEKIKELSDIFIELRKKGEKINTIIINKFDRDIGMLARLAPGQVIFKHRIEHNLIDFTGDLESSGTLQFLIILSEVIDALENGSLVILDEIELKLHQNLVAYIIGLFQNPSENQHGSQLIFSFHNSFFMELLTPEQLWFTEKNAQGYTELFSAAAFEKDIKEIYQKDLEMLYRVGRFGAKPRGL
ncbi:MAG: AAA family ATPase [Pseudomonadota bacterium]|nr:AAA family ATPase [Pseudomonadota bacterium]